MTPTKFLFALIPLVSTFLLQPLDAACQFVTLGEALKDSKQRTNLCISILELRLFEKNISKFPNLRELSIMADFFDDDDNIPLIPIAESLSQLNQLEALNIGVEFDGELRQDEYLSTTLPTSLTHLSNFKVLSIDEALSGEIPVLLGKLIHLEKLRLARSGLSAFPQEIQYLTNLKGLKLDYNNITEVPSFIKNLAMLEMLDLSSNQIRKLPQEMAQMKNLKKVILSDNSLTMEEQIEWKAKFPNIEFDFTNEWESGGSNELKVDPNWPRTVQDAVKWLLSNLSETELQQLKESTKEDLVILERLWRKRIDDGIGLYGENQKLKRALGSGSENNFKEDTLILLEITWQELQKQK